MTLWLFNINMDNGPFMDDKNDDLPILENVFFHGHVKSPEGVCSMVNIQHPINGPDDVEIGS